MKKILLFVFALSFMLTGVATFTACEKEDPKPLCELENVGTVDVYNDTGYRIKTDVTWGNVVENYEAWVNNGGHQFYSGIPAGSIEIWVSFDGSDWSYNYENLSACEDMTYTWYLNSRKSTGSPFVTYIDGEEIIPTLKEK